MAELSARSIIASTLLGTTPPRLAGRLLVDFAEQFGVNPGTTRVALSRMVDRGELVRTGDGRYSLAGALLDRQERQDAGLTPSVRRWSGAWEMWIVSSGGRDSGDRVALRLAAGHLGLREQREGVWLRPDNLDPDRLPPARTVMAAQAERFTSEPNGLAPRELAAQLFDLAGWAGEANRLRSRMESMEATLSGGAPGALAGGFEVAAHTLRHLVSDPQLPVELCPPDWPAAALRADYARYDRTYRSHLSAFFRDRSRLAG